MTRTAQPSKGTVLEELLRAYFLRAGFFVIRGVPFRFGDEELTDVDLWLYDRPTGTSRRVQICDVKYKQRPKAVERIFWTSGLGNALGVDGAYVATTDARKGLRSVAKKLDLQLIDGTDIQRIQGSQTVLYTDRIGDEQLIQQLQSVDKEFRNKTLQEARTDILSALSDGFGAPSAVRTLEGFRRLATAVVSYHPDSKAARAAGRLAYLAAAISCESLDYVSVGAAFRTLDERRELILNAVRLGALSNEDNQHTLKLALALVEKYAPGGKGTAVAVETGMKKDLERIPAEIVADQAVKLLRADQLFIVGRELEMASYHVALPPFDALGVQTKSMLGALFDYAGIDRERFAQAWKAGPLTPKTEIIETAIDKGTQQPTLFEDKRRESL
jgi:hypothetical protein